MQTTPHHIRPSAALPGPDHGACQNSATVWRKSQEKGLSEVAVVVALTVIVFTEQKMCSLTPTLNRQLDGAMSFVARGKYSTAFH